MHDGATRAPAAIEIELMAIRKAASVNAEYLPKIFRPFHNGLFLSNLVLQGGGVLGLAHIGFVLGLEAAGVRFAGLAGTSAGSIAATGMACIRGSDITREVGLGAFDIVRNMPMSHFIDGPPRIRALLKGFFSRRYKPSMASPIQFLTALKLLLSERGLNPGDAFEDWLRETFDRLRVPTCDLLTTHLDAVGMSLAKKPVGIRNKGQPYRSSELLKVIATAMPAGIKMEFPRDLHLLQAPYGASSPAVFVRASMSIPAFFRPKVFTVDTAKWERRIRNDFRDIATPNQIDALSETAEVAMVDGGLMSNLPVDAFDSMPELPTVVLTLISWDTSRRESRMSSIASVTNDVLTLADAVRLQRDRDTLNHVRNLNELNKRFKQDDPKRKHPLVLVAAVDTKDHNWLNFNMDDSESLDLLMLGLGRAKRFVQYDVRKFLERQDDDNEK